MVAKSGSRVSQCILICEGLTVDHSLLHDLKLKSVEGYCSHSSSAETKNVTVLLCRWKNRISSNVIKSMWEDYLCIRPESRCIMYPEYNGIITCSGADEKIAFCKHLKDIKEFDKSSSKYFELVSEDNENDDQEEEEEDNEREEGGSRSTKNNSETSSKLKSKIKPPNSERFTHMLINYKCTAEFNPFSKRDVFGPLNIEKIDSSWNQKSDCYITLITLRRKRSKALLKFCIRDFNTWFPETPIQLHPQEEGEAILTSHKKNNLEENQKFHAAVKFLRTGQD